MAFLFKGERMKQRAFFVLLATAALVLSLLLTPAMAATTQTFTNGQAPDMFLGGTTNTSASSIAMSYGMAIDPVSGKVFVADTFNYRVLRYASYDTLLESAEAEMVFGQADFTSKLQPNPPTRTSMGQPIAVTIDSQGNLYVADNYMNRVVRYANAVTETTPGPEAAQVFGQSGFTSRTQRTDMAGLNSPYSVAVDSEGNLYVMDMGNCRALRWDDPTTLAEAGAAAAVTIGDFDAGSAATNACKSLTQSGLSQAAGLAIDSQDRLYVADSEHKRLMRWDDAPNLTDNAPADGVIGQPDFTSTDYNSSPQSGGNFQNPYSIGVDNSDGIWVADHGRSRILHFAEPWTITASGEATTVLGPTSMTSSSGSNLGFPGQAAIAPDGSLWVSSIFADKVFKFTGELPPTPTPEPSPTTPGGSGGGGGNGGGGAQATATPVPPCTQPATLNVSPATLTISAGGTQTIDLTLSNGCGSNPSPRSDVVVSLSPGLNVGGVSNNVTNLGNRAAIENVILQQGERRSWQVTIAAPPDYVGNPQFVTELYSNGAVTAVQDSLAPAVTAAPVVEAVAVPAEPSAEPAVEAVVAVQPTAVPLPAALPDTAGTDVQPWLLLIGGVLLLLLGVIRRSTVR
jgi:sugar lactone lactonase YvrE